MDREPLLIQELNTQNQQDSKSDVKAILARFQSGATSMEGNSTGPQKTAVHPTLSGPTGGFKKSALEPSLSNSSNTFPKPSYLKNAKSEVPAKNPLVSKFENASTNSKDDGKPPFVKPLKPKPPDSNQDGETARPAFVKPLLPKPSPGSTEAKIPFTKPPPIHLKPVNAKVERNESGPSTNAPTNSVANVAPKIPPAYKLKSNQPMVTQQKEDNKEEEPPIKPVPTAISGSLVKPSSFRAAQSRFNKAEEAGKEDPRIPTTKESALTIPRKPSCNVKVADPIDPSAPKKNPLPNIYAIGSPPSKPNRPPRVNIEKFKKGGAEPPSDAPELKKGAPPPPPPPMSHPSSQPAPDLTPPLPPSLPPRPPGNIAQQDLEYDDIGTSGQQFEEDEEMYEDLDRCAAEAKQQDKKHEKDEKKRAEQEKKEQKEREKKEQDARKKFKMSGPIQVMHKGKARVDCKGGKNDLSFKQGDSLDIIRITENPEGRWLARSQDGSYGYVKTDSVQIDIDLLKSQGRPVAPSSDGDIYDDVASQEELSSGNAAPGVVLPPPLDCDVYDDLDDPNLNISPEFRLRPKPSSFFRMIKGSSDWRKNPISTNEIPPPPQFGSEGNQAPVSDELYDDVGIPVPPPITSIPKSKLDDPKKQKKFEKEEKDFRKKFKFEGEITVLNKVTVINNKKGSGKDLTVQAGEILDVISNSDPDKFICRNKEGKFGYVFTSNIQSEDIYDDIGDDSIYDND